MTFFDDDQNWQAHLSTVIQFANDFPMCKEIVWWAAPEYKLLFIFETGIILHDHLRLFLSGDPCELTFYYVDDASDFQRPTGSHIPKHEQAW